MVKGAGRGVDHDLIGLELELIPFGATAFPGQHRQHSWSLLSSIHHL